MTHKKLVLLTAVVGLLLGLVAVVSGLVTARRLATAGQTTTKLAQNAAKKSGSVLAANDELSEVISDVHFVVNIPADFNDEVTMNGQLLVPGTMTVTNLAAENLESDTLVVTGELTAPNVLYSLAVGSGLTVEGDQDLTITNSDKGSDQKIFKTIKAGSDSVSAGSNTDIFEFVAGSNIGLSLNTTDKKLTISNSYSAPANAWTESGSSVYLTTVGNSVGIGTSTPSYKLHVVGDGYVDGALTVTGAANFNGATFDGDTTLGNATTDNITFTGRLASGTSILPIVDLGADLGSASLRFNNIYVATINTNSTLSTAGQAIFTYEPTSTAYTQASVLINPTAPPANSFLLALGQGGLQRAGIDAEGDLTLGYSSGVSAPNTSNPLDIYGHNATQVAYIDTSGNAVFDGSVTATSFVGSTTGSLNPGFTLGSVAFQGSSGLTQDNANFFWDDSNNRLGIGTITPNTTLDITGTASVSSTLSMGGAIQPSTGNLTFNYKSGANAWSPAITINTVGNVGIGTTTPIAALQISKIAPNMYLTYSNSTYQADVGGSIYFGQDSGATLAEDQARIFGFTRSGGGGILALYTSTGTVASTERMRIDHLGSIGIGTTLPLATLDVRGNSGTTPVASISGQTSFAAMVVDNKGLGDIFTASSSGLNRFVVKQNGNVGIGTTAPQKALHIHNDLGMWVQNTSGGQALTSITGGTINTLNSTTLSLGANAASVMTITSSGTVGIGTTAPLAKLQVNGDFNANSATISGTYTGNVGLTIDALTNADSTIRLREAATTKWNLYNDGDNSDTFFITDAEGDQGVSLAQGATSWAAASDISLKENVQLVDGSLDKIKSLNGYYYNFIGNNRTEVGVIAQEVQTVLPELVITGQDGKLRVMYDRLAPVMINAIKEQQVQIDSLALGSPATYSATVQDLQKQLNQHQSIVEKLQQQVATLFEKAVTFLADATFKGKVLFEDKVTYTKEVVYENKDAAGYAKVKSGDSEIKVVFDQEYTYTPIIQVTPRGIYDVKYAVIDESTRGFTIKIEPTMTEDVQFSWAAQAVKDAKTFEKSEVTNTPSPEPTASPTPSPSINPVTSTSTESAGVID